MKTHITLIFACFLALISCDQGIDEPTQINLDLKSQALIEADNAFGLDLMKQLNETEEGNYTISPLSISLALAMTYNGAEGETKIAMEEAMRLNGLTTDEINQSYQSLVKALLEADEKVTLGIAQSIWYRLGFDVLDEFKTVNQTYYDAEVNELDFNRDDAKDIINGWIEDNTNSKIKNMIERITPQNVMFLINAIYFNGDWKTKFDKDYTFKTNFKSEQDGDVQVDMMMKTDTVPYVTNDLFSAVQLPYGHGNFNMVVMVPNNEKKTSDIIAEFTPENWDEWMGNLQSETSVDISLPKFKDEFKIKLNDILATMGMEVAFTTSADFSGIDGSKELYIDYVQHNTFIDVNEAGTEAAAVTVVAVNKYSAPTNPIFRADRSFVYAITEKETGAILFIGKIDKPEYK